MDPLFTEPELFLTPEGNFPGDSGNRRMQASPPTRVDVVVPVHNHEEMTRQFLDSLKAYTDRPYRLIVVDNGSEALPESLIDGFEDAVILRSDENLGYAGGCNLGIAHGSNPLVMVCNNDLVLTKGWMSRMIDALSGDEQIAAVAPCTNYGVEDQEVDIGTFMDVQGMHRQADLFAARYPGLVEDVHFVTGMCLLLKRDVLDEIGTFDERFGWGNFEDNDLCLRIKNKGLRIVVARDVFVYHLGNRTFKALKIDYGKQLSENEALFSEKWKDNRYIEGIYLEREGNLKAALRAYLNCLKQGDPNPESLLHAGSILLTMGKFNSAARSFRQYIEKCPDSTRARLGLGWSLYLGGDRRQGATLLHAVMSRRFVRDEIKANIKEFMENIEAANPSSWNEYAKV